MHTCYIERPRNIRIISSMAAMFQSLKIYLQNLTQAYVQGHYLQANVYVKLSKELYIKEGMYLKLFKLLYEISESGDSSLHKYKDFPKRNSTYPPPIKLYPSNTNTMRKRTTRQHVRICRRNDKIW